MPQSLVRVPVVILFGQPLLPASAGAPAAVRCSPLLAGPAGRGPKVCDVPAGLCKFYVGVREKAGGLTETLDQEPQLLNTMFCLLAQPTLAH